MFTIADIRNIAIQIERNGEESYRKAAQSASDPELSAILARMADDEKRHAQWFEQINDNRNLSAEELEMEAVGRAILQEMVRDKTFSLDEGELGEVRSMQELLSTSRGFEKDTILFYEMLSGFIDDTETKRQLGKIIDEEKRHLEELEEMLGSDLAEVRGSE